MTQILVREPGVNTTTPPRRGDANGPVEYVAAIDERLAALRDALTGSVSFSVNARRVAGDWRLAVGIFPWSTEIARRVQDAVAPAFVEVESAAPPRPFRVIVERTGARFQVDGLVVERLRRDGYWQALEAELGRQFAVRSTQVLPPAAARRTAAVSLQYVDRYAGSQPWADHARTALSGLARFLQAHAADGARVAL